MTLASRQSAWLSTAYVDLSIPLFMCRTYGFSSHNEYVLERFFVVVVAWL